MRRGRSFGAVAAVAALGLSLVACGDDDAAEDPAGDAEDVQEEVVLQDDFSDPESGFTVSQSETGALAYLDGAYVIDSLGANSLKVSDTDLDGEAFVESPGDLRDVRIEVDVVKASDEGPAVMGVLCRLNVEPASYYGALVDSDGYWRITKFAGTTRVLAEAGPDTLAAGLDDEDADRLRFECVDGPTGATLTLSIGGEDVGSALDPTPLPSGRAAMAAGTRDPSVRGAARFDDLEITALD